jgi:hypothetical protein
MQEARIPLGLVICKIKETANRGGLNGAAMPNWIGQLLALVVLVGVVGFAFRQGLKVTPDKVNADNQYSDGPTGDGSHHGVDGHS